MKNTSLLEGLELTVRQALEEDIGSGDITAELINPSTQASAKVICREQAIICGRPWVDEVFKQVDSSLKVEWSINEGDQSQPNQVIFTVTGNARSILTAERSALNFLQTLSSVSSKANYIAMRVKHTSVKILDTRKTIPGLRRAQKYAVTRGDCYNHRVGLYDAFLIKENHISACGGTADAVIKAQNLYPERPVEIEVESLDQLKEALNAKADIIMLDNFTVAMIRQAIEIKNNLTSANTKLEASGGYTQETIVEVAETGVDYISMGTLTKDCQAVDFSMRFDE